MNKRNAESLAEVAEAFRKLGEALREMSDEELRRVFHGPRRSGKSAVVQEMGGRNPDMVVIDEWSHVDDETWNRALTFSEPPEASVESRPSRPSIPHKHRNRPTNDHPRSFRKGRK